MTPTLKRLLSEAWEGAAGLLYPNLCLNCRAAIRLASAPPLCLSCYNDLGFTNHWKTAENDLTDRFAGRFPLRHAAALLRFTRGNVCQSLIHALKYYDRPRIGVQLGRMLGKKLIDTPLLEEADGFVPVPIHKKRLRQRGYNQAEMIADGLAEVTKLPVFSGALHRRDFKQSQTKLGGLARLRNVQDTFVAGKVNPGHRYLILVDDVVTTGATLDFCAGALLEANPDLRFGVAAAAVAQL